ncbi:MAG TPA: MoaD/ThiS family protein [Vicinamibacterales bacterium]|nr:MoaD/ThiS family protein [Vicinamibacterales bacterium]
MRVRVQLFARLRELAGRSDVECEVGDGSTIADVWREVAGRHPGLAPYEASVSCARNEDFARMSAPVADGDAIAFLPPVSGG